MSGSRVSFRRCTALAAVVVTASCASSGGQGWLDGVAPATDPTRFAQLPCDTKDAVATAILISENPDSVVLVRGEDGLREVRPSELYVSAASLAINEAHDCQRLLVDAAPEEGLELGPLAALYVDTAALSALGPGSSPGVAVDVINFDTSPYAPLDITPGVNCLWIQPGAAADGSDWLAAVRPPEAGGSCVTTAFNPLAASPLEVNRLQHGSEDGPYPSTARWMWDATDSTQFIGVRCGDGWCEIGRSGFSGTDSIVGWEDVPGWRDEQYLSFVGPDSVLRLSGIWGRIEPEDGIRHTGNAAAMHSDSGVHVASIYLEGGSAMERATYENRLGLASTRPADLAHPLVMRTQRKRWWWPYGWWPFNRDPDWALQSPESRWTPLQRLPHTHGVKGSVRWLWIDDDEGGWIPCDQGCCPVDRLTRR